MSVAVVTSCSQDGYNKYGLRFLETFQQHWPAEVSLYLVSEDNLTLPSIIKGRTVEFLSLIEWAPPDVLDFYVRHADNKRARGVSDGGYNFRTDAWKFSKKVFAISLAATRTEVRRLIWLDADVFTFADVPITLFDTLPPDGFRLACLDRGRYHSECGFVAYDLHYADTRQFIDKFKRLYTSDAVFALREWHDSFVFDWLRKQEGITTYKIPHKSQSHPFVNSVLGTYMDHLKGNRKQHGSSKDHPRFHRMPYYYQQLKSRRERRRR